MMFNPISFWYLIGPLDTFPGLHLVNLRRLPRNVLKLGMFLMILCFSLFLVCLWRKKKRNLFSECLFFFSVTRRSSRLTRGKNHRTEWEWEDATRICEPPPDVRRRHKTRGVPPPTHKSPLSRIFPRLSDTYFYIIYWNTTSKYLSSHSFEMWIVNFFFWIESR